jgi:hypothetical protein
MKARNIEHRQTYHDFTTHSHRIIKIKYLHERARVKFFNKRMEMVLVRRKWAVE